MPLSPPKSPLCLSLSLIPRECRVTAGKSARGTPVTLASLGSSPSRIFYRSRPVSGNYYRSALKIKDYLAGGLFSKNPMLSVMSSCSLFGINPPLHAQCVPRGIRVPAVPPLRGGEVLSEQARWAQNLENVATFSKFLGRRKNFSPAHTAGERT